ncbi:hypothetical protein TeGR_g7009, partial [Tetraparma gracilis]
MAAATPLLPQGLGPGGHAASAAWLLAAAASLLDREERDAESTEELLSTCAAPLLAAVRSGSPEAFANLAELTQQGSGAATDVPPTIPFDGSSLTFAPPPSFPLGDTPPALHSLPLVAVRRAVLSVALLSPSSPTAASLLHAVFSTGPSAAPSSFQSLLASFAAAAADGKRTADLWTGNPARALAAVAPLIQSEIFSSKHADATGSKMYDALLVALPLIDAELPDRACLLSDARALFHLSPSVRRSSCDALRDRAGAPPGPADVAAPLLRAWSDGPPPAFPHAYSPRASFPDGLTAGELSNLLKLISSPSTDAGIASSGAGELAGNLSKDGGAMEKLDSAKEGSAAPLQ